MLGLSFDVSVIVLCTVTAISWGLPFFLTFYILADLPAPLVQSVWKKAMKVTKKSFLDASALYGGDDDKHLEQKEIKREKYRVLCLRLDKKLSYEDLERQGKTTMIILCAVGGVILCAGLPTFNMNLMLVGFILVMAGVVSLQMPFMNIDSEIKKLDKALIFETPIFINNVRVMNTKYPLEKVIETYLLHAGPLKQDLTLTLASLKSNTNVKALIEMSNRMQRGERLEEVSTMVDLMKSLYSGTDVERCCINLELLANQINDNHVKPYINSRYDKKMMILQGCVFAMVVFVFLLYVSPMIIEMASTIQEIYA